MNIRLIYLYYYVFESKLIFWVHYIKAFKVVYQKWRAE